MKAENNKKLKEKKNWILLLLKKLAKILFNRIFYVAVAMLVQLGWIFLMVLRLAAFSRYVDIVIKLVGVVLVLWILNKEINPSYKLAWTMLILILPILGVVLYFVFGRSRIAAYMQERFNDMLAKSSNLLQTEPDLHEQLRMEDASACNQSDYIYRNSGYPAHGNTTAEYFQVGDDMFPVLVKELEQAQHYIFIEYFIIHDGVMWRTILDILEKKVKEGLDVRLIYDDMGCLTTLPHKYYETMRAKGIKCQVFNPFRPILNIIQNNRDHRKFCIIDGYVGFTGGVNLADEYINQKERFGHWKDTAVMLKGEAVWNMTAMFLHMWNVVTNNRQDSSLEEYLPHVWHPEAFEGDGFIQPFCDSPLDNETVGENVYLNIINRARDYVYICTPYLVIDNEMMTALCLAAKSGVDVRIMTPGIPDKKLVFILTQSYYRQLLEAGVKIYWYQKGINHSKVIIVDGSVASVGTANMDLRSFEQNFEVSLIIYDREVVKKLAVDFMKDLKVSTEGAIQRWKFRTKREKVCESVARLFAPVL